MSPRSPGAGRQLVRVAAGLVLVLGAAAACANAGADANAGAAAEAGDPNASRAPAGDTGALVVPRPAAREDWDGARERVRSVPGWSDWLRERSRLVDAWMARPRERADLIGGYMHDWVDPASGAPLAWTPETPEPAAGPAPAQERLHRAWVFHLRSVNIHRLLDAARLARLTGEARWRDWAAQQLDFYAAQYGRWPLSTTNGRARLFKNGLDEATASFSLADAARLLEPQVAPARAEAWRRELFAPMAANLQTTASPLTNIGLWHAAAVAGLGLHLRDEALLRWGLHGPSGTRATLAAALGSDPGNALWAEGSFSYSEYVMGALHALVLRATLEGRAAEVAPEREALARLLLAPLDFRFDDGSLPTPGDAAPLRALDARLHGNVYRTAPTWWGLQRAATSPSWDSLLDPPPPQTGTAAPTLPAVRTRHFPRLRMAVLRAGAWQAFVHYGQAMANHAQAEALTYELHHGTRALSTDSGTVSYGSPFHARWFSQGASHNVPLVDGAGQQRWAPGEVQEFDAAQARLVVAHPQYAGGVAVTRDYTLRSDVFSESTTLRDTAGTPRRLGVAFHSGCRIGAASGLAPTQARPPANAATAHWQDLVAYSAGASWSVELECPGARYRYAVQGPAGQRVFIGRAPTTPLPDRRALLYFEVQGSEAAFVSTITRG